MKFHDQLFSTAVATVSRSTAAATASSLSSSIRTHHTSQIIRSEAMVLESFASLLSSALTANGVTPASRSDAKSLPRLISHSVSDEADCCRVPCLMLKHNNDSSQPSSSPIDAAASYLARKLNLNRLELESLPLALLENLTESFMSLVDSRLRAKISLSLAPKPDAPTPSALTKAVVKLLAETSEPISPTAVVTSFRILPVHNGDQVAPLVMETVIDLNILDHQLTVTLVAPGTIQGTFNSDGLLSNVEVALDTIALLESMMVQARIAARRSIIIATGLASNLPVPPMDFASSDFIGSVTAAVEASKAAKALSEHADDMQVENVNNTTDSSSMMPPPPRVPQLQGSSKSQTDQRGYDCGRQTSWGGGGGNANGLSFLTAAAIGLKPCPEHSDQEARRHDMMYRPDPR